MATLVWNKATGTNAYTTAANWTPNKTNGATTGDVASFTTAPTANSNITAAADFSPDSIVANNGASTFRYLLSYDGTAATAGKWAPTADATIDVQTRYASSAYDLWLAGINAPTRTITKIGQGIVVAGVNANTFSAASFVVQEGGYVYGTNSITAPISIGHPTIAPTAGTLSIINGSTTVAWAISSAITFYRDASIGLVGLAGGTFSGTVTIAQGTGASSTRTLTMVNSNYTFGSLAGSTDLVVSTSTASLIISGAGTYSGKITFNSTGAGTLQLTNTNALQNASVNIDGTGSFSGTVTGQVFGNVVGTTSTTASNWGTVNWSTGNANTDATYAGYFVTGAWTITKIGTAKWYLTNTANTSTRTGATAINGGSIVIKNGNILGTSAGAITIASGAALELDGTSGAITTTASKNITSIAGTGNTADGSLGALRSIAGANTYSGTVTMAAATTFGVDASSLTISGVIGGAFALTKVGAGDLRLNAVNTYSGDTVISAGTITLTNASGLAGSTLDYNSYGGTLSFGTLTAATFGGLKGAQNLALTNTTPAAVALTIGGNNASNTYSGNLSGTGSLIKTGTGTQTLSGTNSFTGAISVSNGVLKFDNTSSIPTDLTNSISVTGLTGGAAGSPGISFGAANISTSKNFTLDYTGVTNGLVYFTTNGDASNNYTATINGTVTSSNGTTPIIAKWGFGTLVINSLVVNVSGTRFTTQATLGIDYAGKNIVRIPDLANLSTNLVLQLQAGAILETGSATFARAYGTAANNFRTAGNDLYGGGFSSTAAGGLNVSANLTFSTTLANSATQWIGTMYLGNSYGTSVGKVTLSGTLTLAATQIFYVNSLAGGGLSAEITGAIGSTGGLTKQGSGTLQLSAANGYSGATLISTGALRIYGATGAINSSSGVTVSNGAALELDTVTTAVSRAITLNGTGITNTGALRNVAGTNTYSGLITLGMSGTTIYADAGTLNITNVGTIAGAGFNLNFAGDGNIAVTSIIGTTTGTVTKTDAGTLTLTGANTFTGNTYPNGGSILINNASALQNSTVVHDSTGSITFGTAITATTLGGLSSSTSGNTIALTNTNASPAGVTLSIGNNNATTSYAGTFTGLGGITKVGSGKFTLTNTSSHSGASSVNAGTLSLTGSFSNSGASVTVNSGGTLEGTGSIAGTVNMANSATAIMSAGVAGGATGNLTMGGLVFAGAANLKATNASYFTVNGNLNTGSGTITVDYTSSTPLVSGVNYPIISYTGTKTGSGTFVGGTISPTVDPHDTLTFTDVSKTIVAAYTADAVNVALTWAGTAGSVWNTTTTNKVWTYVPSSLATYFKNSDGALTFGASGLTTIPLNTAVSVGSGGMTMSGVDHTISGSGTINNSGPLSISGAFVQTLNVAGEHGAISIAAGSTLGIGNGSALGSGTGTITITSATFSFGRLKFNSGVGSSLSTNRTITLSTGSNTAYLETAGIGVVATLGGIISGGSTGSLTKTGSGVVWLKGANTYAAVTRLSDNTVNESTGQNVLRVDSSSLPSTNLRINNTSILEVNAPTFTRTYGTGTTSFYTEDLAFASPVFGLGGGFSAYQAGGLTISAPITFGTTTATQWKGTMYFGTGLGTARGQTTWSGTMNLNGRAQPFHVFTGDADTVSYPNGSRAEIGGKISGTVLTGTVSKRGPGVLKLSNDTNDYYSDTFIYEGTLEITSIADDTNLGAVPIVNSVSSIGCSRGTSDVSAAEYAYLNFGSSTESTSGASSAILKYVGTNPNGHTSNRSIRVYGGGTIDASGVGPLNLTYGVSGSYQLILQGTNQTNNKMNSVSNLGKITKQGVGKWILSSSSSLDPSCTFELFGGTLIAEVATVFSSKAITINGSCLLDLNSSTSGSPVTVGGITLTAGTISNGYISSSVANTVSAGFVYAGIKGAGGINKSTTGTLLLAGTNSYTGATAIANNGGTIIAESESASNTFGSGASAHVTVGQGGKIWTKTGTLQNGKMTYPANLTFNGSSGNKARLRIGKTESVVLVQTDGALKFTAATNIDLSSSSLAAGTYTLFDYGRGSFFGGQSELNSYVTVTVPTGLSTCTVTDNVADKKVYITLA
jgi:autotransporter-associated beta strand protein